MSRARSTVCVPSSGGVRGLDGREVEATEAIGAGRYERVEGRVTERNGTRPRLLTTQAGDIGLRIPKLRKGSFFPRSWSRADGSIRRCTRW
jgi:transposase-like protein